MPWKGDRCLHIQCDKGRSASRLPPAHYQSSNGIPSRRSGGGGSDSCSSSLGTHLELGSRLLLHTQNDDTVAWEISGNDQRAAGTERPEDSRGSVFAAGRQKCVPVSGMMVAGGFAVSNSLWRELPKKFLTLDGDGSCPLPHSLQRVLDLPCQT